MHLVVCDLCQPVVLLTLVVVVLTPDDSGVICTVPPRGCSGICPEETYESRPCTDTKDRECSACSLCRKSFYEVSPCTAKSNRRCYHAAHPLLLTGQSTIPRFIEEFQKKKPEHKKHKKLKVEASSNIFLEDLQNTRNLETTIYVTDMTQASDFYWDRESELRVNIGILDIHLIPEYYDVNHDGDNEYMLNNPNESEERSKYQHIIQSACRNPIPDYYSITLEVSPDRTTVAYRVKCDSKDSSKPKCLPPYRDGDTFLYRTLNEPCHKMLKGTFPEVLLPAANSIVCTDNSALLSEIFNRTFTEERPIRFPPKKCTTATIRCNQCKNSHHCQALDMFAKKCCHIDCYNLIDCKIASSEECLSAPVECAMGDAYSYTIQPVFHTIKNQFRCHLQHHRVTILYKLFYFIQIPAIGFQTPKVHQTIYAHDLGYHQNGKYKTDYLTVEHNTGLNLHDDFILSGHELNGRSNYTVYSATVTDQSRRVDIHDISDKVFMASAQFERPFDYSSSTWVNNNDCNKNISKIKPIYDDQSPVDAQEVSVLIQNSAEPFQYFLKSVNSPPFIRFTVPGNTSILPYYFQDNGPFLYTNESLSVSVELSPAGRIWLIHVTGKMSGCPAYLGLTINDRLEMEQLFRYDLLIVCPQEFNLTFKVPNWGQQTYKTFDITFQDPSKTFTVFSTYLGGEHRTTLESHSDNRSKIQPRQHMSLIVFLVVGIIAAYSVVMSFFVRACVHRKRSKFSQESADGLMLGSADQSLTGKRLHEMVSRQICLTTTYVVTRFVYCLFMSVTALSLGILFLTKHDIAVLSRISQFQIEQADMLANISAEIEREIQVEIVRYQRLVEERQTSCSNYIGDLMIGVSRLMETLVYENHLAYMYGPENSISYLIVNQTQMQFLHYMESADDFLIRYKTKLSAALSPLYAHYSKYLRSVYGSEWLMFAQRLFNATKPIIQKPLLEYETLTGEEVDFSIFLQIEEVEDFQMWSTQFWEQFYFQYPNLPSFPDVNITRTNLNCDADIFLNVISHPQFDHFDSTHFFGTYYFGDAIDTKRIFVREKLSVTDLPRETRLSVANQDSMEVIGSSFLWLVCICLDVLLMSYRMCRTYCCAKALYSRLQQPMPRDRLIYRKKDSPSGNGQQISTNHLIGRKETHQLKEEFPQTAETVSDQYACIRYNDSSSTDPDCYHDNKSSGTNGKQCRTVHCIFSAAVRSKLVPHLVVTSMLMVLLCFILKACMTFLEADALINNNIFGVFVSPVVIQANLSSSFVTEQTEQMSALMRIYENQMHSELASLKSIMFYLNLEQKWLVDNYIRETCAFHQLHIATTGRNCDIKVPLQNLDVPILPCNFLPIEPRLYIEFTASTYERQMAVAFQQFASSIASVVFTILRYLFILVAIMLTVHMVGNMLLHCLRVQSGSTRRWTQTTAYLQVDQHSHPFTGIPNSSEHEPENYDLQRERRPMTARATTATLVNASPTRVTAMLFDFGYSETKV